MAMLDEKVLKKKLIFLENETHTVLAQKSANRGGDPFRVGAIHVFILFMLMIEENLMGFLLIHHPVSSEAPLLTF